MSEESKIPGPRTRLYMEVIALVQRGLDDAVERCLREAAVAFYSTLPKLNDKQRHEYSSAMNLIESNQDWIARNVCGPVMANLKSLANAKIHKSPAALQFEKLKIDQLSLVSKDEFEDWLVVERGIKKIENELSHDLYLVRNVLSALLKCELAVRDFPLSPYSVMVEFKRCIDKLEVAEPTQDGLYKAITENLLVSLKALYRDIKNVADKHGLEYSQEKNPNSPARNKAGAAAVVEQVQDDVGFGRISEVVPDAFEFDEELGLTEDSTAVQVSALDTLSRLATSVSTGSRVSSAGGRYTMTNDELVRVGTRGPIDRRATQQLVSAISSVQQAKGKRVAVEGGSLRAWLDQNLPAVAAGKSCIGQQEAELVNVTDRFFDVIVDKVGVSGVMQGWLEKLKLTILKIVLKDDTFFSDVDHPARQMLNKLAKLGRNTDAENGRLHQLLDNYVERVVTQYDKDDSAVEKMVEQLSTIVERQELAFKRNSERIARTYEGKQKVASTRHKVVKDLNDLLAGQQVPVVLMELLDKAGYREFLALQAVREGEESEIYQDSLKVVEQLFNWFTTEVEESERWALELEMELEAPNLIEIVRRELSSLGMPAFEGVMSRLDECLLRGVKPILIKLERYEWPYERSEQELAQLEPADIALAEKTGYWHKRVLALKIGDWVEFKDEQNVARCMRLAWSGSRSFRFVFVDSQGMKDEDISLESLVEYFKQGRAIVLEKEDVPLVDQGLHQMVQGVYEELSTQASCDVLTGLLNRQAFERGLKQAVETAVNKRDNLALLFIDIDQFNVTNASYGHAAGDACLKHVAELIRRHALTNSFVGRLSGNEFGLLLPESDSGRAMEIATALCASVKSEALSWEGKSISSTVSIGVAPLVRELDNFDSLLQKATAACASAKAHGKNRVLQYTDQDEDQKKREALVQWVNRLDGDLDELLILRCQEIRPVAEAESNVHAHYEILLGVRDGAHVLPPAMLIEAAEHFGRISRIDRWVLQNVIAWMTRNKGLMDRLSGLSVNLSGGSLSDERFIDYVYEAISAATIDKSKLCFEITETAAISNINEATEFIRSMKRLGCKFSLDDFGSGLSSYAYIQSLPVDYIKIDGLFIRNLATNPKDQALVRSINELAHFMGMKTVAEFVESHEILEILKKIGVDHCQGYGIKKPGLLEELAR